MTALRLKDLPEGAYKQILLEADQRGTKLTSPALNQPDRVMIGLADIIAELRARPSGAVASSNATSPFGLDADALGKRVDRWNAEQSESQSVL